MTNRFGESSTSDRAEKSHETRNIRTKDELERGRYLEKQRSSKTFKIICGPVKLGGILSEMANGPAQSTLSDLKMPRGSYYAEVTTYMNNYL